MTFFSKFLKNNIIQYKKYILKKKISVTISKFINIMHLIQIIDSNSKPILQNMIDWNIVTPLNFDKWILPTSFLRLGLKYVYRYCSCNYHSI